MPRFSGFGPGKGTWTKRRYDRHGNVVSDEAPKKRTAALHTRFKPFVSHQLHESDAKELGLKRTHDKGTVFETERQLDSYLAHEKRRGRDTQWKAH